MPYRMLGYLPSCAVSLVSDFVALSVVFTSTGMSDRASLMKKSISKVDFYFSLVQSLGVFGDVFLVVEKQLPLHLESTAEVAVGD